MKKIIFYFLSLFFLFSFGASNAFGAEELFSENSKSMYGTITSISRVDHDTIFSVFDGSTVYPLSAAATTPCLYQGKNISLSELQTGSQILVSYCGETISSILVLSLGNSLQAASSLYGMYYDVRDSQLSITIPGGELKTYPLATSVVYFVNQSQVSYSDFYHLSFPGDDIKIYLNAQNEVVKIESYIVKDYEVAKTNPSLLQ